MILYFKFGKEIPSGLREKRNPNFKNESMFFPRFLGAFFRAFRVVSRNHLRRLIQISNIFKKGKSLNSNIT